MLEKVQIFFQQLKNNPKTSQTLETQSETVQNDSNTIRIFWEDKNVPQTKKLFPVGLASPWPIPNDNSGQAFGAFGRPAVFDCLGAVFDRLGAVFDRFAVDFDRFGAVFDPLGAVIDRKRRRNEAFEFNSN